MKHLKSKDGRIILSISALCLTFLVLIWVSYFRQQAYDRQNTIAFSVSRNSNLAVALEQYTIRTIHYADAVLQLVKVQYASEGKLMNIEKLLSNNEINKDIIKEVAIIDRNGRLVKLNINEPTDTSLDFSTRSYFIFHVHNSKDSLFISKPIRSKITGKPVVVISRRLNDQRERFSGVVALQIEPSTFTSFYAQANLSPNDIISLISTDGITYARRTGAIESYGEDIIKSPLFSHVEENADSFYFAKDAIRGIPTWFSYRKLKDYPIIATVGSSEANILAGYYSHRQGYLIPHIITSLLSVLISVLASIILLHRKKMAERLMQEEKHYQSLLTQQVIAAQERERASIGRELHDNVNQVLTTVKLYLEMALNKEETKDQFICRSMQLVHGSIHEIRNLSHQLSAPTLGTGSLVDAINALIEMVVSSGGLVIEFDHRGYCETILMSQKLALYRIVQEQLNNVIKHAAAKNVLLSLKQNQTHTVLTIKDDGKGFNSFEKTTGIGLNNIITRTKAFNGKVHIETAPQKGCKMEVVLPTMLKEEKTK